MSRQPHICTENAEGPGEPAAGDIWRPSTWDRVSPRLGKHHKGLKKKGGGRVDGFSCRYRPAPRMSPDSPANEAQVTLALDTSGQGVRRSNDGEEQLPGIALV